MEIIYILIVIFMFIISTVLYLGKGAFLIAGLNAMSDEDKEKINTFKLNRFMGKMMFFMTIGTALLSLYNLNYFSSLIVLIISLLLIFISIILIAFYTFNFRYFRK